MKTVKHGSTSSIAMKKKDVRRIFEQIEKSEILMVSVDGEFSEIQEESDWPKHMFTGIKNITFRIRVGTKPEKNKKKKRS